MVSAGEDRSVASRATLESLRLAQEAVPPGEAILLHTTFNGGMDFKRNHLLLCDYPGGSSPPPGMPQSGTAEDLAAFLRGQGIFFVAYSVADHASFPVIETGEVVRSEARPEGARAMRRLRERPAQPVM